MDKNSSKYSKIHGDCASIPDIGLTFSCLCVQYTAHTLLVSLNKTACKKVQKVTVQYEETILPTLY